MFCNCSSVHVSKSTDLTRLMWVPMPRWNPEHLDTPVNLRTHSIAMVANLIQIKTPKFQLAHRGSLLCLQSAQTRFAGSFNRFLITAWLAIALSAAAFGRRDIGATGGCGTVHVNSGSVAGPCRTYIVVRGNAGLLRLLGQVGQEETTKVCWQFNYVAI